MSLNFNLMKILHFYQLIHITLKLVLIFIHVHLQYSFLLRLIMVTKLQGM